MNIIEELLPLVLFMVFGVFTFILPIFRQRRKLKKPGAMNKRGKGHSEEKDEYPREVDLRLERDRMRENLSRRHKPAEIPRGTIVSDSFNPAAEKKEKAAAIVYRDPFPLSISSLTPLKKAVILSEILGKPKGFEE